MSTEKDSQSGYTRVPVFLSSLDLAMNPQLTPFTLSHPERDRPAGPPFHPALLAHPESAKRRRKSSTLRWLFFIGFFCVISIVLFFVLAHAWGYSSTDSAAPAAQARIIRAKRAVDIDTKIEAFRSRNRFKFVIKVFGWNRRASLDRLCTSLLAANYHDFPVDLEFYIDGGGSRHVSEYARNFEWPHGKARSIVRSTRLGLRDNILTSWENSKQDEELAFFFEDDIEVSPYYFEYCLLALSRYQGAGAEDGFRERFAGVALMTLPFDEVSQYLKAWQPKTVIGSKDFAFWFQLPCSWGALYFPWVWREFLAFYGTIQDRGLGNVAFLPSSRVNMWQESWKRYMIQMFYVRGMFMLYPSLPNNEGFSRHHKETGQHTDKRGTGGLVDTLEGNDVGCFRTNLVKTAKVAAIAYKGLQEASKLPVVAMHHNRVSDWNDLRGLGSWTLSKLVRNGVDPRNIVPGWDGCLSDWVDGPVNRTTKGPRYITFQQGGDWQFQIKSLAKAVALAKTTNRTLLIPPFVDEDGSFIAADQIIDVPWLRGFVPAVTNAKLTIDRVVQLVPRPEDVGHQPSVKTAGLLANARLHHFEVTLKIPSIASYKTLFGACNEHVLAFQSLEHLTINYSFAGPHIRLLCMPA